MLVSLASSLSLCAGKRYSEIDQHLTRHFRYNSGRLSPPFLCSKIITPFYNSMISYNQETGL